jgi:hypothetical protein
MFNECYVRKKRKKLLKILGQEVSIIPNFFTYDILKAKPLIYSNYL